MQFLSSLEPRAVLSTPMSDSKTYKAEPATERRTGDEGTAPRKAEGWEAYSSWLNRIQKTGGRHAAITRNLYSWNNYKNWADKVRGNWEEK
ncbi:MAG TPA: hypothetical protein VFR59_09035 [Steroidobacteraceae bacterium]|nr:hypothetical protein [Steroidobacteraceae bacterium]